MAFQTSLSGLNAAQANLSVTGNNIANSSTNGFKKSRAEFADIFASSFAGSTSTAIGSGVRLAAVAQQFTQGNVEFTENNLDLAINGEGFFIIRDDTGYKYTRAGAYGVDREGYVVNSMGQRLQSYQVNDNGSVTNFSPSDLRLSTDSIAAKETDFVELNLNLDADETIPVNLADWGTITMGAAVDPNAVPTPALPTPDMYNFSTSVTVYDSLGGDHSATLYFAKTADNTWEVYSELVDSDGNLWFDGPQDLIFTADGQLDITQGSISTNPDNTLDFFGGWNGSGFDPSNGALTMGLSFDLAPFGLDQLERASTQYAGNSGVNSLVQDGYTTGRLSSIDIDETGVVFARYTNGQSQQLGAVAVANFVNPQGLSPVGDNNWVQTFESGDVVYGQAGSGTFGQIQSGALEASNVDLSKQLVNMIVAQRDFQANAKMISTEDQITQTIINIR